MERPEMERLIRNIDARLERVEQILPTLTTKHELQAAKGELHAAIAEAVAPLATRAELREEGERTRRHFDVVAERMHDDVKLSLEGHQRLTERVDDLERATGAIDRRVRLLEASAPRRKR